jgi:hypothetical protein
MNYQLECIARESLLLINYLKTSDLRVGVLLDFGAQRKLEWARKVH